MRARALLRVAAPSRIVELHGEAPLGLRSDGDGTVWLVGTAAAPVGGDDLELRIEVGAGARVAVRSVAAQLALPGPGGPAASVRVVAAVAAGAHLDWAPEPTIVAAGADLRQRADVELDAEATLRWREALVLGRHGEEPGRLSSRLGVDLGGRPLVRHELAVGHGPGWDGPAGLAGARAVTTELRAGGGAGAAGVVPGSVAGDAPVVLPLDGDGVLLVHAGGGRCTAGETGSMV